MLGEILLVVGAVALKLLGDSSNSSVSSAANKISDGISSGAEKLGDYCEKADSDYRNKASKMSDEQLRRGASSSSNSRIREICQQELDSRK